MTKYVIVSLSFAATLIATCQGLECYSCWDVNIYTQELIDVLPPSMNPIPIVEWVGSKSCGRGKAPHSNLTATCSKVEIDNEDGTKTEIKPVCSQWTSQSGNVKYTARGCFHGDPKIEKLTITDKCQSRSPAKIHGLALGPVKELLDTVNMTSPTPGESGTSEFCHCNSDNCNVYEDECLTEDPPERCLSTGCTDGDCGRDGLGHNRAPSIICGRMYILPGVILLGLLIAIHLELI